jgi:pimeloyl-ACP methyl ester carboxylesterase
MVSYSRQGKGKIILLLHGWGTDSRSLKTISDNLSAKYDVIAVDLPGFGGSQNPKTTWNMHDFSDFVVHFLQKIGVGAVYAVVGHSNGGAIAVYATANNSITPQKLVLIAASGIRQPHTLKKTLLKTVTKAGKVATIVLPGHVKTSLRQKLYSSIGSDYLVATGMHETFKKIVGEDLKAEAATIKVPTLLLYGRNDTATPLAHARTYNSLIKGSTLQIVDNAGHFIFNDAPEITNNLLKDFLKK